MTRRTKDQIERDRNDLLAVLEERGPQPGHQLAAQALGYPDWDTMLSQHYSPALWQQVLQAQRDLGALRRKGAVVVRTDPGTYRVTWRLATPADLDEEDDEREVARMQSRWDPVE